MVNVEGELIADVLITDGIIEAVHKGVEVQCVTGLQLFDMQFAWL